MLTNSSTDEYLNPDLIPPELKAIPQWVCWTVEERNQKFTKIPINPKTGGKAMSNKASTWGTFDRAFKQYKECENDHIPGLGFVFSKDDPFCGIDLDHCRNPETGEIDGWATEIIKTLDSYTEISPSGTGVKTIGKGSLPIAGNGSKNGNIEMVHRKKFFTVTGYHLEGTPLNIEPRQKEIGGVYQKYFGHRKVSPSNPVPTSPVNASDSELIEKGKQASNGKKFQKLLSGDWSDYPSPSEGDLALCSMLSFWTGRGSERIDRLFRQSGLMRAKWDERHFGDGRTYGQSTIEKAIEGTTEVYSKSQKSHSASTTPSNGSLLNYNLTDAGNAECYKRRFAEECVFVPEKGKWLHYDGIRWSEDNQAILKMLDTVRERGKQAWDLQDIDKQKAIIKWCLTSESKMKLNAALSIAESMMSQSITSFDSNPSILCCSNGPVDLKTGDLLKPKKEDWLYKSINTVYDPVAGCERFLQFLSEVFNGDKELIDFIQRAVGYSFTGLTTEQVLFILYGTGANGKSVFLNIIGDLLGDYALTTPASTFKDNPYHDGIPNDIARMAGARLVKSIEVKEGTRLNEERIKALTGGDRVTARFLHNEFFEFTPVCKFWIAVNHKPIIRGSDEAIWRRIRLIPFEIFFPPERRDPHLYEKLKAELPGILVWAVEGCLKWRKEGLEPSGKVKEWTDNYRAESDLIAQFLEEKTSQVLTGRTKAGDLYRAYESWCKEHGEFVISGTKFGKRMEEKGFEKRKNGYIYYHGLELI